MSLKTTFFLILALCTVWGTLWSWAGRTERSRWWVGRPSAEATVLLVFPFLALLLLIAGTSPWIPRDGPVNTLIFGVFFLAGILAMWGIFVQKAPWWLYPRWHPGRKGKARKKGKKRGN